METVLAVFKPSVMTGIPAPRIPAIREPEIATSSPTSPLVTMDSFAPRRMLAPAELAWADPSKTAMTGTPVPRTFAKKQKDAHPSPPIVTTAIPAQMISVNRVLAVPPQRTQPRVTMGMAVQPAILVATEVALAQEL